MNVVQYQKRGAEQLACSGEPRRRSRPQPPLFENMENDGSDEAEKNGVAGRRLHTHTHTHARIHTLVRYVLT